MRIDGQNPNITAGKTPDLSPLSELNLKDGQKVIGRIVSLSTGEALLDLAGRILTAKIEGNPPFITSGAVLSFRVNVDNEGKIQLKVLNPVTAQITPENATPVPSEPDFSSANGPPVPSSDKVMNARSREIINALLKNDLPALPENIAKIARTVQNFQLKTQLPLETETAAFVMAQKWPSTDAVLLTALLLQDRNLRNQLWNAVQQMGAADPEVAQTLAELQLNMEENAAPIIAKFKTLNTPVEQREIKTASSSLVNKESTLSSVLERLAHGRDDAPTTAPQKLLALLEQNLDLQKALYNPSDALYNMMPLLIRDSRNELHECFVEWRSEPRRQGKKAGDQHLSLIIPTENMGTIRMTVGLGTRTTIALKVASSEVREFLTRHTDSLRESIPAPAIFSVSLDDEKTAEPQFNGVDVKL